jgi:MarR family transcriptional regulator, temperature-dependent positive regulator of motility
MSGRLSDILELAPIKVAYKMGYVLNFYREPSFRQIEAELGLTRPEIVMLIFLNVQDGITASDICSFSGHLLPSMSRAAIALESKGFIRRKPDRADMRRQTLFITAAGRSMHKRFMPGLQRREDAMLAALNARERAQFERLLAKLSSHVPAWGELEDETMRRQPAA